VVKLELAGGCVDEVVASVADELEVSSDRGVVVLVSVASVVAAAVLVLCDELVVKLVVASEVLEGVVVPVAVLLSVLCRSVPPIATAVVIELSASVVVPCTELVDEPSVVVP